jgi:VanZ family protein
MKMAVFWVVAPSSLVEVYQHFRGTCASIIRMITLMVEAAITSEILVNFYQTTWCYNPEDSHL